VLPLKIKIGDGNLQKPCILLCALFLMFLTSCAGTNVVKDDQSLDIERDKRFLEEIKKVQEEKKAVTTDEKEEKSDEIKKEPEPPEEIKAIENPAESSYSIPPGNDEKVITVAAALPSTIIEEITITTDPEQGIIVDESVVEDFEEKYEPLAEKEGFKETEENIIREEIKREAVPDDVELTANEEAAVAVEDVQIEGKEVLKELGELRKLESIKDIKNIEEPEELKKPEEILEEAALEKEETTYDVPIVINRRVEYFLNYFQNTKMKRVFSKWLNRSEKYLPMMRKIFEEKGLPKDLTYLAMIESGFNTSAYSRARAVGPWQFIRGTGRRYGLRIDHWVDERRDPKKSTIAAANYLKDLYALFGSWYLAAAGYNAGEGKINRAIKRHKTEDFWELSKYRYLKRETKNYIPKFLAATLISKEPEKYGFSDIEGEPLYEYDIVEINEPTDLEVIAKSAGVKLSKIKELNPELRRWYTPPERDAYELKIPKGTKDDFLVSYSKLKPTEKINFLTYRIKYGETLSHVARRFGTSVSAIMKTNRIRSARYVRAGIELTIPIKGGTKVASLRRSYKPKIEKAEVILIPKGETVPYTVKKGDTLWGIAQRSGINIVDIIKLNNIKNSLIHPGMKLLLYKEPKKIYARKAKEPKVSSKDDGNYYTVKNGDSLWSISEKLGIPLRELRKMNKLTRRSLIHPGKKLLITYKKKDVPRKNIQIASSDSKHVTHKVKRGDTLWDIAKKYNTNISALKKLNNLRSNRIKPGDVLKVKEATTEI
jgi:membrane-bound lytic murein transglycosylase D